MHRLKLAIVSGVAVAGVGAAVALATDMLPPQISPGTSTQGFFVSNSRIDDVPLGPVARAAASDGSRTFLQRIIFSGGQSTGWHSHPGPVFVMIVSGSLTYEDPERSECLSVLYNAGQGFVDRGYGNVHRAVAGASGAEFWAFYLLPPDIHAVRDPVSGSLPTPPECA